MVGMYTKLKSRFTVDTHAHYIFTPRDLTSWTLALLRYDLSLDDGKEHVLQVRCAVVALWFDEPRVWTDFESNELY